MRRWRIVHREELGLFGTETRRTVRKALEEVAKRNAALTAQGLEPVWQVAPR